MSEKLLARIQNMDDFLLVRFFNNFSQNLFNSLEIDREQLLSLVPEEIRTSQELSPAFELSGESKTNILESEDAVVCARGILEVLAQHPGFEDALEQALDEYKDDDMLTGIILALGITASMIIVASTTKLNIKFEDGKITGEINKTVAPTQMVKEIVSSLTSVVGEFLPS